MSKTDNPQEATNKKISEWLKMITDGTLLLPSFQRQEAWQENTIKKFLHAVYKGDTLGISLLVRYDSQQQKKAQLKPRHFDGINSNNKPINPKKVDRLVLDGQQRLTALWKVFNDGYGGKLYCIQMERDGNGKYTIHKKEPIVSIAKKSGVPPKESTAYLNRRNESQKCFGDNKRKKLLPLIFFNPIQKDAEWKQWRDKWLDGLPSNSKGDSPKLKKMLNDTWKRFSNTSIPYFLLSGDTTASEAATVFMNINTGSKSLTKYDLVVADIDKETGKYLEDTIATEIKKKIPSIEKIDNDTAGELAIKIACIMNDKSPSGSNYMKLAPYKKELFCKKEQIVEGINWTVNLLQELKVYEQRQLPSVVPLRVLPALHQHYQDYVEGSSTSGKSSREREALKLVKRYIWHSFLTDRYMRGRVDNELLEDYKGLKAYFENKLSEKYLNGVPIFSAQKPVINTKNDALKIVEIRSSIWPGQSAILARGILLASLQEGGHDPLSGKNLNANTVSERNFHHIFPKSKLKNIKSVNANLALNCLFISASSNGDFDNELPGTYLNEICQKMTEEKAKQYLKTHCIDEQLFNNLLKVKDQTYAEDDKKLREAYDDFIQKRALLLEKRIEDLLKNGEL